MNIHVHAPFKRLQHHAARAAPANSNCASECGTRKGYVCGIEWPQALASFAGHDHGTCCGTSVLSPVLMVVFRMRISLERDLHAIGIL